MNDTEYEAGYLAYEHGYPFNANASDEWRRGWIAAYHFWTD